MLYIMLPSVNRRTALPISKDLSTSSTSQTHALLPLDRFFFRRSSLLTFISRSPLRPPPFHILPIYYPSTTLQLPSPTTWLSRSVDPQATYFFWLISTTFTHVPIDNLLELALPILGLICRPSRSNFLPFVPLSPSDVFSIYNFTLQKTYPAMEQ